MKYQNVVPILPFLLPSQNFGAVVMHQDQVHEVTLSSLHKERVGFGWGGWGGGWGGVCVGGGLGLGLDRWTGICIFCIQFCV